MKKVLVLVMLLTVSATVSLYAQRGMENGDYQKSGSVVRGIIHEEIPNETMKIKTVGGSFRINKIEEGSMFAEADVQDPENRSAAGRIQGYKSPGLALGLSAIVVGLGQHYTGQHLKGAIQEVIFVGGIVVPFFFWGADDEVVIITRTIGAGVAVASWIWSVIDAPFSASKANRSLAQQHGHLMQFGNDNVLIGLAPTVCRQGFGARLTVHF